MEESGLPAKMNLKIVTVVVSSIQFTHHFAAQLVARVMLGQRDAFNSVELWLHYYPIVLVLTMPWKNTNPGTTPLATNAILCHDELAMMERSR